MRIVYSVVNQNNQTWLEQDKVKKKQYIKHYIRNLNPP